MKSRMKSIQFTYSHEEVHNVLQENLNLTFSLKESHRRKKTTTKKRLEDNPGSHLVQHLFDTEIIFKFNQVAQGLAKAYFESLEG